MINIDWVYNTYSYEWRRGEDDADGNRFSTYFMYGNRLLAKVYDIQWDDTVWSIIYINKNWRFRKYTVYWYYNITSVTWFILWVLYNGERESNQPWDVSNMPV